MRRCVFGRALPSAVLACAVAAGCAADNPAYRLDGAAQGASDAPDGPTTLDGAAPDLTAPPRPPDAAGTPSGLSQGLVGYWRFDDPPGSPTIRDHSSNGNTGTPEGLSPAAWVPGQMGTALEFRPGSTPPGVRVNASVTLDGTTRAVSVAAWVYPNPNGGSMWRAMVSRQRGTASGDQFVLGMWAEGLHWDVQTGSGLPTASMPRLPQGAWTHAVGTWDGATLRLYADGKQVAMLARVGTITVDANPLFIGTNKNAPNNTGDETFNGRIDEVAVWNRALTAAEVAALFARGGSPL